MGAIQIDDFKFSYFENGRRLGYIEFRNEQRFVHLIKTFVFDYARGKGIAKMLNEEYFKYLNKNKISVMITCPYSEKFYNEHKKEFPRIRIVKPDTPID